MRGGAEAQDWKDGITLHGSEYSKAPQSVQRAGYLEICSWKKS